jgi:hypothetical protein
MKRRFVIAAGPALAAATLIGCARSIDENRGGTFTGTGSREVRLVQIERAAESLGWRIEPSRPGAVRATLSLRTHVAVVEIAYDETVFTIRYVDSRNLDYTGTTIHRAYNGWTRNLETAISQQPVP